MLFLYTNYSLQSAHCSYLGYPRFHFAGRFFADPNICNNDLCAYRLDKPPFSPYTSEVTCGTNEFQFHDCKVTSVVYQDGTFSMTDPVVGQDIVGNLEHPLAKMVDNTLNYYTTLFGMKFGIKWSDSFPHVRNDIAFYGKWSRNIIAHLMWDRMKCYSRHHHGSRPYQVDLGVGAQSTTTITDIDWSNLGESEVLHQLRDAVGGGNLSVRITLFGHTYTGQNKSLGYVVGVVGVPSPSDTLNLPGERVMHFKANPVYLTFDKNDICYNFMNNISAFGRWFQYTPFEVDKVRNEVRVDLSNSLPSDIYNSVRNLGILRLGISMPSCVYLLGDEEGLPYASTDDFPLTSAVYSVPVDASLMHALSNHPLVLAQVLATDQGTSVRCGYSNRRRSVHVVLQEYPYLVHPKEIYVDFLDRYLHPSRTQTVYITHYGAPMQGMKVDVKIYNKTGNSIPAYGVIPTSWSAYTDSNGLAAFEFTVNKDVRIPIERHFKSPPCKKSFYPDNRTVLPVDGQVYFFYYCVNAPEVRCEYYSYVQSCFYAQSDVSFVRPYTWVKDVGPILTQYAQVTPIMKKVLDLSDYSVVTLPRNLNLLKKALRVDIDDPSYMPTTRDLSPVKRMMILEWLEDPKYDLLNYMPPPHRDPLVCSLGELNRTLNDFYAPRCEVTRLRFDDAPQIQEPYFSNIFLRDDPLSGITSYIGGRPLSSINSCNIVNLRRQLQNAMELEWATIPIYLTSLYSIVDGYNTEIYEIIRSIITQEMLHMTQSANILIAMHGSPLIDHPSVNPSFPIRGLPGGVLPGLEITLEKLSLAHVYKVFMGIEVPQKSLVSYPIVSNKTTVGVFYHEIKDCIDTLGDEIFDAATLDRQVKWPWLLTEDVGHIVPVTDSASAGRAIEIITSQGEGSSLLDPEELGSNTLSHFYKFEEIVCQRHLEKVDNLHYAYVGAPIPFDPSGVWPMRPNPKASTVLPETECYIEAHVFHQVYRSLLHRLQLVFNGHSEDVFVTVQLMKSLGVHAQRLMSIKYRPDDPHDDTTCGPVWDYFWPDVH